MGTIFVIQNQYGHYLNKQSEWVDGRDKRTLYRTVHRDEAVNTVFELSSKDVALRAAPLECEVDENNHPKVEAGPAMFAPQPQDAEDDEMAERASEDQAEAASTDGNDPDDL